MYSYYVTLKSVNVNVSRRRLHIFHSALHLNVLILMMQSASGNFTHRIVRGRKRNEDRLVEDSTKKIAEETGRT